MEPDADRRPDYAKKKWLLISVFGCSALKVTLPSFRASIRGEAQPMILWLLLLYDQLTVLHPHVADEIREF